MKFCRVICQKYFIFPVLKFEITFFILYVFYFFTSIFKPFYTFQQVLLFTSISRFLTHSHSYYPFNYFRKPIRYKPELGLRLRSENMRYAAEMAFFGDFWLCMNLCFVLDIQTLFVFSNRHFDTTCQH